ncbi:hypothetical protein M758_UG217400 [Ceratodon purpureus]|nr:hypothetical protein M758_UG217400 [Ceratodon purpureus]
MHALVYEEENGGESGRIVVAYRGTQIGSTVDCIADMCVDAAMWVLPDDESSPLGRLFLRVRDRTGDEGFGRTHFKSNRQEMMYIHATFNCSEIFSFFLYQIG